MSVFSFFPITFLYRASYKELYCKKLIWLTFLTWREKREDILRKVLYRRCNIIFHMYRWLKIFPNFPNENTFLFFRVIEVVREPYPGAVYPPGVPAPADPAAVQLRDFHFLIIMYRSCANCLFMVYPIQNKQKPHEVFE